MRRRVTGGEVAPGGDGSVTKQEAVPKAVAVVNLLVKAGIHLASCQVAFIAQEHVLHVVQRNMLR